MPRRHPDWLKTQIPGGPTTTQLKTLLRTHHLHTICEEAKCPNLAECFNTGTAVFLILGPTCTRHCRYCHVTHGTPHPPDPDEPNAIADSVHHLHLTHAVITSVTRDDLPDGGAHHFADTITTIRTHNPGCTIEVLIPDFHGDTNALQTIVNATPDIINHNIEVVQPLFPHIRPGGDYHRSLTLLKTIKTMNPQIPTKSGLMVGLGETETQIKQTLQDLRAAQVDFLTIGQYLQPTRNHEPIHRYYTPAEFDAMRAWALAEGFTHVESGPLVRSSYHASNALHASNNPKTRNHHGG